MRSEITRETTMISDLSQDLFEEILSRVPVRSLRLLRPTCKRWNALLKDRGFMKRHFAKTARQYQALMLMNFRVHLMSSYLHGVNINIAELSLNDPHTNSEVDISQAFHCDGVLLCTTKENRFVMWNPFSGQTIWVQPRDRRKIDKAYALGYANNDLCHRYKIMRFPDLDVTSEGDLELEIYEFSSNSWRNVHVITPEGCLKSRGVSLKGNAYWVYLSKGREVNDYSLLSFDFSTETFQSLCVPFDQEADCFDTMALSVVREEHLSLLYQSSETLKLEIWMSREIEITFVSWKKFLTVDLNPNLPMFSCRMSFFIDEEKKVAVCCEKDSKVYIVGEDEYSVSPGFYFYDFSGITCCPTVFGYVPRLV